MYKTIIDNCPSYYDLLYLHLPNVVCSQRPLLGEKICVATNDCKNTLLHVAALHGNTEAVLTLMNQGVAVANKNNESKTPMHLAAANGHAR